jgi:hypothetical protein
VLSIDGFGGAAQVGSGDGRAAASFGLCLGAALHCYREGYRFARLACDLFEKHDLIAYKAKVCHAMGLVAFWTQPFGTAMDFMRAASRTGTETGNVASACTAGY